MGLWEELGGFMFKEGGHVQLHWDADIGDKGSNVQTDTQEADVPQRETDHEEQGEED